MWKAPNRPNHEISQSFCDGMVTIYSVADQAEPGRQPVEKLSWRGVLRYDEQRLGIQRYYAAAQNQVRVERVIRTPRVPGVNSQDVAITEDGQQYRIDLVQNVKDVYPASMDLTLVRIEQQFEVDP